MSDAASGQSLTMEDASLESATAEKQASSKMDKLTLFSIIALSICFTGSNISTYFGGAPLLQVEQDLKLSPAQGSWIPNSGSLTSGCSVLVFGYIQDLTGRRVQLALGLASTLLGALLYALADTYALAIVGNIFGGFGTIMQELTAVAAISELVPSEKRGLFLGLAVSISIIFTPAVLYANLLDEYTTLRWRWLQWINFMWNGVTAILLSATYFRLKIEAPNRKPALTLFKEIDYVGIVLLVASLALILVAVAAGGMPGTPWSSAQIIVELVVGCLLLVAFVVWEIFVPSRPLIPTRLFRGQRVVGLCFVVCIASGMNFTTALNLGPTIIDQVFRLNPITDGLVGLSPGIGIAIGAACGNFFISTFKAYCRANLVISTIFMTAFTSAQACITATDYRPWIGLGLFSSMGIGASLVPLSTLMSLACPTDLIGTAVAFTIASRTLGGSIGYAIFDNIYTSGKEHNTPTQGQQVAAASAAKNVFLATIPFGVIAIIAAAFLPDMTQYMSKKVITRSKSWHTSS